MNACDHTVGTLEDRWNERFDMVYYTDDQSKHSKIVSWDRFKFCPLCGARLVWNKNREVAAHNDIITPPAA